MTDDAAIERLGARTHRNVGALRTRRKTAKLLDEARKLGGAAEAQIRNHRDFLHIAEPDEMLERPKELVPGQEWRLVFDNYLYEHIAVIGVRNGIVVAHTEHGQLVAVESAQLLCRGHFLGWLRSATADSAD
jgi:hypothetical protein